MGYYIYLYKLSKCACSYLPLFIILLELCFLPNLWLKKPKAYFINGEQQSLLKMQALGHTTTTNIEVTGRIDGNGSMQLYLMIG